MYVQSIIYSIEINVQTYNGFVQYFRNVKIHLSQGVPKQPFSIRLNVFASFYNIIIYRT